MGTAPLDSFQLIIGLYLGYVALKGEGNMYRFPDVAEKDQPKLMKGLRILYALGAVVAVIDGTVCLFGGQMGIPGETVNVISPVCTTVLFLIFIGIVIWARSLTKKRK